VCFGIVVGLITYRTLIRSTAQSAVSDLGTVVGVIGGAAITGIFAKDTALFGLYGIGLLGGVVIYFVVFLSVNGKAKMGEVMSTQDKGPND